MGHAVPEGRRVKVVMAEACSKRQGLTTFLRAVVTPGANGLEASLAGSQGSHMLQSMARANALLWVPAERSGLAVGDRVDALLLDDATEVTPC
ncbi:molybdopterin biosynthesis protein MoeA [compost metagenome]